MGKYKIIISIIETYIKYIDQLNKCSEYLVKKRNLFKIKLSEKTPLEEFPVQNTDLNLLIDNILYKIDLKFQYIYQRWEFLDKETDKYIDIIKNRSEFQEIINEKKSIMEPIEIYHYFKDKEQYNNNKENIKI